MEMGARHIVVKVVLFQLGRHGHPKNDATPDIFLILGAQNLGFQIMYYLCNVVVIDKAYTVKTKLRVDS